MHAVDTAQWTVTGDGPRTTSMGGVDEKRPISSCAMVSGTVGKVAVSTSVFNDARFRTSRRLPATAMASLISQDDSSRLVSRMTQKPEGEQ